jgi:hypothetical protein
MSFTLSLDLTIEQVESFAEDYHGHVLRTGVENLDLVLALRKVGRCLHHLRNTLD